MYSFGSLIGQLWYHWSGQAERDAIDTEMSRLLEVNRSLRAELDARDKQLSIVRGALAAQCADNKALRWKLDARDGRAEVTA